MEEIIAIKRNPMSFIFLITSVTVFLVAKLTDPENIRFLAFDSAELPARWHTFITYGFVHVDWNHIIVNMLILIWVGLSIAAIVFGWLPSIGHFPHIAGAITGLVFLSVFRTRHKTEKDIG